MGDEKLGIVRLEHDDLHRGVRFDISHECCQLNDRCGHKHVDRWVAEGDRPLAWPGTIDFELRKVGHDASPGLIGGSVCSLCKGDERLRFFDDVCRELSRIAVADVPGRMDCASGNKEDVASL